ncbi:efflux RND transporter periplasmic adaptor subunit [Polymorphum gilvum]|uniref:Efflux transporter, RND family, MFP subunit n=1 Tax=Polymorphum gilvum (strain LMG 25793 / CGMCC 1.9160 / SL003B-26A1) TaxID=991905 RepID=F2J3C2_POLGS|nr:efflux RND transporter periplasmic adaptor subunit [Polymorphum gilvum]ADZ69929.1 Efflux transporter, RND family, MFP subunit [Polymorphum gilvum SL003B-26A1]
MTKQADPKQDESIAAVLGAEKATGRSRLRRRAVYILLALAIGGAAAYRFAYMDGSEGGVRYVTERVTRGDMTISVTATGTVEPTNQVDISSELSGMIRKVGADYNDRVAAGQVLAELDTDKLNAEVAHARASLRAKQAALLEATATVEEKRSALDRMRRLMDRSVVAQSNLEEAQAAYDRALAGVESAEAAIEVAKADLQIAETNLQKACICSPIDGIVLDRQVDPGQYVASSLQAPVLFTVAEDLSEMDLRVDIDEADVGLVREGQTASFTVDAYPDRVFPATIHKVRYAPESAEGVVTYKAELKVDNGELLLRPGMTATAEIVIEEARDVLMVPNVALRYEPPQTDAASGSGIGLRNLFGPPRFRSASENVRRDSTRQVYVLRAGAPVAVPVVTGVTDGVSTRIVEGELAEGDAVIVDRLSTGR